MKKNQVSIKIVHMGENAAKECEDNTQPLNVYCDANNIYEALVGAFYEALTDIQEFQELPGRGSREHHFECPLPEELRKKADELKKK